ncbi:hydrogenase-1 operon protein HyaF2 [Salmonella enterica subsp. enterica serovar Fulica]|nr:hydrogenase-1 operon protein HyaF2 [Salmonella enterica subsp. enterica serovar Fulica]
MNYSRTIPVVNIGGPGSQPEEEDFNFLPIPAGINLPLTPVLPEQALPAELRVARHILTTLIRDMDNPVATLPFPLSYKLNATEQQNSGLLDQLLGEGEISARVLLSDGKEQRIQETVFTGVWRVREYNADQQRVADEIIIGPIPESIWQTHPQPPITPELPPQPAGLMNGAFIAHEIAERVKQPVKEPHIINLTLLPVNDADREYLDHFLGEGCSAIFSRGYGKCRIVSTHFPGVWRVNYFNDMNTLLQDMIEIADIPDIAVAGIDDIEDAYAGLKNTLEWLKEYPVTENEPVVRMECKVCWWVYDPALGDDVWQIPPGVPFNQLPDYWCCPVCETSKSGFMVIDEGNNSCKD